MYNDRSYKDVNCAKGIPKIKKNKKKEKKHL